MAEAVIIGAGPNGLVAANVLADRGWDVLVLEEQPEPGGAVRSGEITLPGFTHDLFSAFYPLAAASPVMVDLGLEEWGLQWRRAPLVVGHPRPDGHAATLWLDVDKTVSALDERSHGDGAAWADLYAEWQRLGDALVDALLRPFPPVRPGLQLAAMLRNDLMRFVRMTIMPVRRFAEERFHGDDAGLLLAANALHADLTPEMPLSALMGYLLCFIGQQRGYPVPEGGASALTHALVSRLEARGGRLECNQLVVGVEVANGTAVGVRLAGGETVDASRAVLADVSAPALYRDLVGLDKVPARVAEDLAGFQLDNSTVKIDWALDRPCPWTADDLAFAGTIHIADDIDHLTRGSVQMASGVIPARPTLVVGQMNAADPTRSPAGTATMWAYAHVPQRVREDEPGEIKGTWDEREKDVFAERVEREIEAHAPGFSSAVKARHVMGPNDLEAADRNLVGGAINGGTSQLHQQLFFRPIPGRAGPHTPIRRLYLASASAHPGGGVHGACGANAARAALRYDDRARRWIAIGVAGTAIAARRTARS